MCDSHSNLSRYDSAAGQGAFDQLGALQLVVSGERNKARVPCQGGEVRAIVVRCRRRCVLRDACELFCCDDIAI